MTEVNKEKSAARLASLKKCAAALTLPTVKGQPVNGGGPGVFNPFAGTKQVAKPQKPAAPQYYKPGVPMHQSTGNYVSKQDFLRMSRIATPWAGGRFIRQEDAADLVARGRLSKDNVARATGTMTPEQYMMQRHGWDADKASTYRMPVSGGLPVRDYETQTTQGGVMKTSSDRSAARLASLKKCAAADRSAKRLETLKKCAERGFTKVSEDRSILRRLALMKCAGIATDYLATLPTAAAAHIPGIGLPISLAGIGGTAAGLLKETKGDENPKTEGKNFIPGVGTYRLAQRIRRVADQSDRAGAKGTRNLLAEVLGGGLTAPIIGAGVGGLAGLGISAATGGDKGVGAGIGAGAGAALPQLIGALAAAITKRRSRKEQTASDTSGRATAKYLVPGLGAYDYYKRLGASGNNDPQKA